MKATKLPSGNWRVRVELPADEYGKRIQQSVTAPTEDEALAAAYALKAKKHKSTVTFAKAAIKYNERLHVSPATLREYESKRQNIGRSFPSFAKTPVRTIGALEVQKVVDALSLPKEPRHRLQKEKRALRPKTVKDYAIYICAVLRSEGTDISVRQIQLPKAVPDIAVPDDETIRCILDAAKGDDVYVPVLLAAFGPLRRGEIAALEYPRDFAANTVHIHADMVRGTDGWVTKQMPKNEPSDRFISLPENVIAEIEAQGYVTHMNPDQIYKAFRKILKKSGLPLYRFHALRHWCASTLHAQGVSDAYIMQRGGWSTDTTLKRVYRHTLQDQSKLMTAKALNHFSNISS